MTDRADELAKALGLLGVGAHTAAMDIPFVCGERQRELLGFQRGETDLVYRDEEWFLFTTVEVPDTKEREALDWLGCDFGIVNIVADSDGHTYMETSNQGFSAYAGRLHARLVRIGSADHRPTT